MTIKAILEKLEDAPEALRDFYSERDGVYVLAVDDSINDHPTVKALKNAYERVKAEKADALTNLEAAQAKLANVPDDFDPDEYIRLRAGKNDEADQRIAEVQAAYEKRLDKEIGTWKEKYEREQSINSKLLVDDGLTKALLEARIAPEFMDAVKAMMAPRVKLVDRDGDRAAVIEGEYGAQDVAKYIADWAASDKGRPFVPDASGSGARGGNGKGTPATKNPWAEGSRNLSEQSRLWREDKDSAKRLMRAAGYTDDQISRIEQSA